MKEKNLNIEFEERKCCVLIPTYNNEKTIRQVIEACLEYTTHIIIVNDGSTDNTSTILSSLPHILTVTHIQNQGKGKALRTGFSYAQTKGYEYAISMDSDGQHFAHDLFLFLSAIKTHPRAIIIGDRNMSQSGAGIPAKSSFGNRFSSFWFQVNTGITLPDTQSGYRLYPLLPLSKLSFVTTKFEFEIEVLVKGAWSGLEILTLPISIYYAPPGERVSHFRPFKDFTRITILNTVFVILAVIWFRPFLFFKSLAGGGFKKKIGEIISISDSPQKKSLSIGFGIFMGIVPLWGFQMLIAFAIAHILKLNKALVLVASNVSMPILLPFILYASYLTGAIVLGNEISLKFTDDFSIKTIHAFFVQYLIGAVLFATVSGIIGFSIAWVYFKIKRSTLKIQAQP